MFTAIIESLPIALAIVLSTLPLVAVPLFLLSAGKRQELTGFLAGWGTGFLLVGSIVLIAAAWLPETTAEPRLWMNRLQLLLGLGLLGLAWKYWRSRPKTGEVTPLPGWIAALEGISPRRATGLGLLLAAVNPKNVLLVAAGAMTIATTTPLPLQRIGALVVFAAIASLGIASPVLAWLIFGQRVKEPLDRLRTAMTRHHAVIMAVVLVLLGVLVAGKALSRL